MVYYADLYVFFNHELLLSLNGVIVFMNEKNKNHNDVIFGRNPVMEAVKSGRAIESIIVARGSRNGAITAILAKAREKGIVIKEADPKKLDYMTGMAAHQGIAAVASVKEYSTVEDILNTAKEKGEDPFIIILDEIEDPHNLGAIIRTAECAGVHGVIISQRRSAGLTFAAGKASAGAVEYMNVAKVVNIPNVIDKLKENGVWVYGADMDGELYTSAPLTGPIAIVIGNEGKGIGPLVRKKCDGVVSLPMTGRISSLNASVAAGILTYEIVRQRTAKKTASI